MSRRTEGKVAWSPGRASAARPRSPSARESRRESCSGGA
jgi:hypothetical protein